MESFVCLRCLDRDQDAALVALELALTQKVFRHLLKWMSVLAVVKDQMSAQLHVPQVKV